MAWGLRTPALEGPCDLFIISPQFYLSFSTLAVHSFIQQVSIKYLVHARCLDFHSKCTAFLPNSSLFIPMTSASKCNVLKVPSPPLLYQLFLYFGKWAGHNDSLINPQKCSKGLKLQPSFLSFTTTAPALQPHLHPYVIFIFIPFLILLSVFLHCLDQWSKLLLLTYIFVSTFAMTPRSRSSI